MAPALLRHSCFSFPPSRDGRRLNVRLNPARSEPSRAPDPSATQVVLRGGVSIPSPRTGQTQSDLGGALQRRFEANWCPLTSAFASRLSRVGTDVSPRAVPVGERSGCGEFPRFPRDTCRAKESCMERVVREKGLLFSVKTAKGFQPFLRTLAVGFKCS